MYIYHRYFYEVGRGTMYLGVYGRPLGELPYGIILAVDLRQKRFQEMTLRGDRKERKH